MAQIRLTTTLAGLRDQENIRVNCLGSRMDCLARPLAPQQRRERGVPDTLLSLAEVAGAVLRLATDEALFGRIMVWWNGQPPRFISQGDPGFQTLD